MWKCCRRICVVYEWNRSFKMQNGIVCIIQLLKIRHLTNRIGGRKWQVASGKLCVCVCDIMYLLHCEHELMTQRNMLIKRKRKENKFPKDRKLEQLLQLLLLFFGVATFSNYFMLFFFSFVTHKTVFVISRQWHGFSTIQL